MDEDKKPVGHGIGMLICGVALGIIATLVVSQVFPTSLMVRGGTPPYESSCIIKVGLNSVVGILADNRLEEPPPDVELIKVRMLGYESVMAALSDTDLMSEIEQAAEENPDRRGQLENELHRRIVENTTIERLGQHLIKMSYRTDTPDHAVTVLQKIVNHFVENALKRERTDARKARDRALADLTRSKQVLASIDAKLVNFLQDHPGVCDGSPRERLQAATQMLSQIDAQIASTRRRLDRYAGQIKIQQKAPDSPDKKKTVDELTGKALELEATLDALREVWRNTTLRRARLEEEARAFPSLHRQLVRLEREAKAAEEDHELALKRFKRVNDVFNNTVEGLVSVSILKPARRPYARN